MIYIDILSFWQDSRIKIVQNIQMNFNFNPLYQFNGTLLPGIYNKIDNSAQAAINPNNLLRNHPPPDKKFNYITSHQFQPINDKTQLMAMTPQPQQLTTQQIKTIQQQIQLIIGGKLQQQKMTTQIKILLKPLIQQYNKLSDIVKKCQKITHHIKGKSVRQALTYLVQQLLQNDQKLSEINNKLAIILNEQRLINFPNPVICEQYVNSLEQKIKQFIHEEALYETKHRLDVLVDLLKPKKTEKTQKQYPANQPIAEHFLEEQYSERQKIHEQIQKKWADQAINKVKKSIKQLKPGDKKNEGSMLYNRNTSFIEQEQQCTGYLEDILKALGERMGFDSIDDLLQLLFYNQEKTKKWKGYTYTNLIRYISGIEQQISDLTALVDNLKRKKREQESDFIYLQDKLKKEKEQLNCKLQQKEHENIDLIANKLENQKRMNQQLQQLRLILNLILETSPGLTEVIQNANERISNSNQNYKIKMLQVQKKRDQPNKKSEQ